MADPFAAPDTLADRIRHWHVFQPWLQQDPVTPFAELRAHAPVVRSEEFGGYWILTRYADLEWAARNPEIFSSDKSMIPHHEFFGPKMIPIELDGLIHRTWRLTLSDLFSPDAVKHLTPGIRSAASSLIDPIVEKGSCNFITDFAVPLPADTFLTHFGIGREYLDELLAHKDWLAYEALPKAQSDKDIQEANQTLWTFFGDAINRRRTAGTEGRTDVLSRLLHATHDGRPLTQDEMINVVFLTMMAALDSTNSALGMIFLYLAEHPEVQDMVVADPAKIPTIIEELLRYEPITTTARVLTRDIELHGVTLHAGDQVLMPWGMAGRDPEVFPDPDHVDFTRSTIRHLGFGIGPHRCLGMFVARSMLRIALEEWHARIPRYHVTPGCMPLRRYTQVRGLNNLEITMGAPRW